MGNLFDPSLSPVLAMSNAIGLLKKDECTIFIRTLKYVLRCHLQENAGISRIFIAASQLANVERCRSAIRAASTWTYNQPDSSDLKKTELHRNVQVASTVDLTALSLAKFESAEIRSCAAESD